MAATRALAAGLLASGLAIAPALPALAQATPAAPTVVQLTPAEADALKLRLIMAKPNVSTVTIASFVFPGSSQAYMGHVERTLLMWGTYILAYTASTIAIPDSTMVNQVKVRDLALVGSFMGMATWSALDAYGLSLQRRNDYDAMINRLTERSQGMTPASMLPIRPE